jgi:hypothetical protein
MLTGSGRLVGSSDREGHAGVVTALQQIRSSYPGHSGYPRVDDEYYREPAWIIDALLDVVPFTGSILDPCCGGGRIPSRCLERGMDATGSDIVKHGFGTVQDFFDRTAPVDNVISNPPYCLAEDVAKHALGIARHKVALLLRLAFLEGRCRRDFFQSTPPAQVLVSIRRVSCPPGVLDGPRDRWGAIMQPQESGGKMPYAWFVWQVGYTGQPVIGWL